MLFSHISFFFTFLAIPFYSPLHRHASLTLTSTLTHSVHTFYTHDIHSHLNKPFTLPFLPTPVIHIQLLIAFQVVCAAHPLHTRMLSIKTWRMAAGLPRCLMHVSRRAGGSWATRLLWEMRNSSLPFPFSLLLDSIHEGSGPTSLRTLTKTRTPTYTQTQVHLIHKIVLSR